MKIRRRTAAGLLAWLTAWTGSALAQAGRVQTVTRQVRYFGERESALISALQRGAAAEIEVLLDDDFEMRVARHPGSPVTREEFLGQPADPRLGNARISQMAVHDQGEIALVSFLLRLESGAEIFVVDAWHEARGDWKLQTRYASASADSAPMPGEPVAQTEPGGKR